MLDIKEESIFLYTEVTKQSDGQFSSHSSLFFLSFFEILKKRLKIQLHVSTAEKLDKHTRRDKASNFRPGSMIQ